MGIFRAVISSAILVIFIYVAHQLTRFTDFTWLGQSMIVSFLILLFSMVIGTFLFFFKERSVDVNPWRDRLINVSLTAMAYINFLITLVILRDIFAFADNLFALLPIEALYSSQATSALLSLPVLLLLIGNAVVKAGPLVKRLPLKFKDLPPELEGLRIIHVTDLHIGATMPLRFVKKLVSNITALKPDLVVFTGDILDGFAAKHTAEFNILRTLKAPDGIFYVPGNHEYYWDIHSGLQAFRDAGFHVLLNDTVNIKKGSSLLQVMGTPDPAARAFDMEGPNFPRLKSQLAPESFKLGLVHQPFLAPKAQELGVDLLLAGHTHGGQFFPWNWLIVFFQKYSKGHYRLGTMQLYVNQGTGYWGPQLRLGTYCELTEIVLRKG